MTGRPVVQPVKVVPMVEVRTQYVLNRYRKNQYVLLSHSFRVPMRLTICCMLGISHPSSPPVAEINRTKSRMKRHF